MKRLKNMLKKKLKPVKRKIRKLKKSFLRTSVGRICREIVHFFRREFVRKILKITKNVVCWGFIIILSLTVLFALFTRINGGSPTIFGLAIHRISSGSMEPELKVGDIILDRSINSADEIKVDDIITFEGFGMAEGKLVTHKVIKAPYESETGEIMLQTMGIANDLPDEEMNFNRVHFKMASKIPIIGDIYNLFLSPWGLIIFIGLLLLVFIDEVINIVRILSGYYDDDEEEDIETIIKRIQREEIEEALEEKRKQEKKNLKKNNKNNENNNNLPKTSSEAPRQKKKGGKKKSRKKHK